MIRFPDWDTAYAWYHSSEYQAILPLRLNHSSSVAAIVPGVPHGYRAADSPGAQHPTTNDDDET